jgi:RNA polymerase sigma-70 factor (ECF subfamily)
MFRHFKPAFFAGEKSAGPGRHPKHGIVPKFLYAAPRSNAVHSKARVPLSRLLSVSSSCYVSHSVQHAIRQPVFCVHPVDKEETERLSSPQSQTTSPDLALVTGLKSGDQGAMAQLYDRYSSVVYAVALRVLGDTGAAEDVLQEVFLQLWRKPSAFDAARGSLASWLAVITRNRAIDFLRKRRPETDIEDVVLSVAPDLAGEADRNRAAEKVRGVMVQMAPAQRSALEMAYWQGMSHTEIADKTGEPLGTVKTRIRSGLIALRKAFQT